VVDTKPRPSERRSEKYLLPKSTNQAHLREHGSPITTLVAEGSQMGCQLMASAFEQSPYPIRVTALAVDSHDVWNAVKDNPPDVAIIGTGLIDGATMGLKTARELWVSGSKTKVIILIDATAAATVIQAVQSGAYGIICRDEPFERLCKCIYVVRHGQVWISSNQLLDLIDYVVQTGPAPVSIDSSNALTKREESIIRLVAEGLTNRAISHQLSLSENTVRNYLFRIFNKVGVSSRLELALYENNRRQVHGIPQRHPGPITENRSVSLQRPA
jgi:two-component system, NarL family, nitrate/nitrite response regulator NarL